MSTVTSVASVARSAGTESADELTVDLLAGADAAEAVRTLVEGGADVSAVETERESLEEIFLKLVEEGEEEVSIR